MDQVLMRQEGLRILVAEDEPLAAMVIEDALTEAGHSVLLAADGEEAERLAQSNNFDLLVTDLAMPRMTGWELIPRLRAEHPNLPVVVMTGFLPPNGREILMADGRGPLALLLKPFELHQLMTAIDQVAAARATPAAAPAASLAAMR